MDLSLTRAFSEFVVHHARGSCCNIADFQPIDDTLAANTKLLIQSSPWPSTSALPFFNVEYGGRGMILGIGWTEGWAATFTRNGEESLSVKVGPSLGHFVLHPGEEVRSLRMLVLFWKDDRIHGHNLWRQLLLKHYSPTPGGKPLQPPLCHANWGWWNTQQQIARLSWWKKHDLPMEVYWMDIGWERDPTEAEAKQYLATCVIDEKKHPHGLKPISDACHKLGMKYLLWFGSGRLWPSVERVQKFRPELLSAEYPGADSGNPMINKYMIADFANNFADWGVDVFRPDAHSTAVPDSAPNRQGINQARSAAGFIEFWDALLKRSPNLLIDNCYGGGQNIDLETIQRSIAALEKRLSGQPEFRSDRLTGPDVWPLVLGSTERGRDRRRLPRGRSCRTARPLLHAERLQPGDGPDLVRQRPDNAGRQFRLQFGPTFVERIYKRAEVLLRRLLSAHAIQPRPQAVAGMAVRQAGPRSRHGPGIPS